MESTTPTWHVDLDAVADEVFDGCGWTTGTADGDWFSEKLGDDWIVSYHVVERDSELVVAEVRVQARPRTHEALQWFQSTLLERPDGPGKTRPAIPRGGLPARRVRPAIRPGAAVEKVRDRHRLLLDSDAHQEFQSKLEAKFGARFPEFSREAIETPRHVGRRGRTDLWYAQIAAAYLQAIESGRRRDACEAVAEHLRAPDGGAYDAVFVRDAIGRARKRGLLTKPSKGRAGGQLTDKARAILERGEQP